MGVKRQEPGAICVVLACLLAAAVSAMGGQAQPQSSSKKSDEKRYARPADPALYVGSETCKTCHADMPSKDFFQHFENSPHFVTTLDTKKGPE